MKGRLGKGTLVVDVIKNSNNISRNNDENDNSNMQIVETYAPKISSSYPIRLQLLSQGNRNNCIIPLRLRTGKDNKENNDKNDKSKTTTNKEERMYSKALECYILGYGGGLVSGDSIEINLTTKPKSTLVVTSPSSGKVFKHIDGRDKTRVKTNCNLGAQSLLVLALLPTQCFSDCRFCQHTNVIFDEYNNKDSNDNHNPSLVLIDWYTGGRKMKEKESFWSFTSLQSVVSIHAYSTNANNNNGNDNINKSLLFRDGVYLTGGNALYNYHMKQYYTVICMVLLIGPRVQSIAHEMLLKYSTRASSFDDNNNDRKEGMNVNVNMNNDYNTTKYDFIVSCGTLDNIKDGVILRLAANSIDVIGKSSDDSLLMKLHEGSCIIISVCMKMKASFISKNLGTLNGQLDDYLFMDNLSSPDIIDYNQNRHLVSSSPFNELNLSNSIFNHEEMFYNFIKDFTNTLLERNEVSNNTTKSKKIQRQKKQTKNNSALIYQLVDSSTPTGGFAHSNTIEAAYQYHFINHKNSAESLFYYSWDVIVQTISCNLIFILASYCNVINDNDDIVSTWEYIDRLCNTYTTSHVSRRASTQQGIALLRIITLQQNQLCNNNNSSTNNSYYKVLCSMKKRILKQEAYGHYATIFGTICGILQVDTMSTVLSIYIYVMTRDMINAAVRMNIIGPLEGVTLIQRICIQMEELLQKNVAFLDDDDFIFVWDDNNDLELLCSNTSYQVAPIVEILANAHDRLYTRLFNS